MWYLIYIYDHITLQFLITIQSVLLFLTYLNCIFHLRRLEIDSDNVEGPFSHRGPKKNPGDPILPMLVDSELYKSFLVFATQELKLEPFA
jgi:hypothetical protein